MNVWLTIVLGGALTFAIRFSFIGLITNRALPAWVGEWLRLVPVAALAALIAPEVANPHGGSALLLAKLLAGVAAALAAWRTRNVAWAVVAGMGVFFVVQAVA